MKHILQPAEDAFGPDQAGKCDLLLELTSKKVSYAIVDGSDQLIALAEMAHGHEELSALLKAAPLLSYRYRNVKISVETEKFTFIPAAIFSEDHLQDYLRFVQPENAAEVLVSTLPEFKIKNLVAIPMETQEVIRSHFPATWMGSQIDPFVNGLYHQVQNGETAWFLNFRSGGFEAALVREGELLFYNLFRANNPDEFNYFLLLLLKQFPSSNTDLRVVASGAIDSGDPFFNRLQKYFSKVQLAEMTRITVPSTLASVPLHHYFSLLHLSLCE